MAGKMGKLVLFLLLVLPSTFMIAGNGGSSMLVGAQEDVAEDVLEGEEDEATVETDEAPVESNAGEAVAADSEKDEEEEESPLKSSPNGDTHIMFTKPTNAEFPAGEIVKFLVGFTNKGDKDFVVETMDASFRYPQDYSFYIQNFTTVRYARLVEPSRQATFEYAFTPSETFNARPFGLTINLNYKDVDGNIFQDAVFNETVNIIEADEGLDTETFFLYVFLAAVAVLLLVGAQQLLQTMGVNSLSTALNKRLITRHKKQVEMGTQNKSDVDYDWLPKETLDGMNKSPRRSPKQSPGRRRMKRGTGSAED